jgi:hypothetical protein
LPRPGAPKGKGAVYRLEKDGSIGRIASHIQTEKTLNFLFEHSRKVAE